MRTTRLLAVAAAALILAGCGGSAQPGTPATTRAPRATASAPSAQPSSAGATFCASLKAAVDPQPVYLNAVIAQDDQISSFSTASPGEVQRAARAQVASWIAVWCPHFAYLEKSG